MKNFIKGLLVGLCCLCMNIQAQNSGQCGDNAYWKYENGTLRIWGSGGTWDMHNYGVKQPWYNLRDSVKVIIVENGITEIGGWALSFVDAEHVELPSTLRRIIYAGISTGLNLKRIIIPENVEFIGRYGIAHAGYYAKMDAIVSLNTTPPATKDHFGDVAFERLIKNETKLYVPGSSLPAYREDDVWKEFGEIIPISMYDGIFRITKISMVDSIEGYEGETVQLTVNIEPANATLRDIRFWESTDTSIVEVSDKGLVTLKYAGEAIVRVKTVDGGFIAETKVKVWTTKVKKLEILNTNKKEYDKGEKIKITYKISPETALNKNVTFSSSNPEVASVDTTGLVQCMIGGETTITVTTEEGGFTDKINITVKKNVNANLKSLDLNFDINPAFDTNTPDYFATVGGDIKRASMVAEVDEYATVTNSSQELKDGNNTIIIRVTAEDETIVRDYYLHVYRKSAEARLKSMVINQGSLEPAFSPNRKDYIWRITKKEPYMTLVSTLMHDKAIASVSTVEHSYTRDTTFLFLTTAEDNRYGEKYTVKVEAYEDNAHLKDLRVEEFELKPEFQPHISKYDATVSNKTREVKVVAVPDDSNATVSGQTGWIQITGAEMLFTINVLAEDRISYHAYQIRIRKEALATDIEKVEDFYDERVAIYTVDGRYLGVTERENRKIVIPDWLGHGVFIAKGSNESSNYREKFTN